MLRSMLRLSLSLILCCCLALPLVAVEEAAVETLTPISNQLYLEALRARFGDQVAIVGAGPVRFCTVGAVDIPKAEDLLALAAQVSKGLDAWTGRQGLFEPQVEGEAGVVYLILFADGKAFEGFVDHLRKDKGLEKPEGEDLTKKLKSLWRPRCFATVHEKFLPIADHFTVNLTAGILVKTYFQQRGEVKPPPWLIEGIRSEMEMLLTKRKTPLITSIAYEMNDDKEQLPTRWSQAMSQLVSKGDQLKPARDVMLIDLIKSSRADYVMMWSFNAFLRSAGGGKGEENRFAQLLDAIARGADSPDAVTAIYGLEDPKLTRTWLGWAGKGRR